MKKILLSLFVVGMLFSANANAWWISSASAVWLETRSSGNVYLRMELNGNIYNYRFSNADPEIKKIMIASAMTAVTAGNKVSAEIVSSEIQGFYLIRN